MRSSVSGVARTAPCPGRAWSAWAWVINARATGRTGSIWKRPGRQYKPAGVRLSSSSARIADTYATARRLRGPRALPGGGGRPVTADSPDSSGACLSRGRTSQPQPCLNHSAAGLWPADGRRVPARWRSSRRRGPLRTADQPTGHRQDGGGIFAHAGRTHRGLIAAPVASGAACIRATCVRPHRRPRMSRVTWGSQLPRWPADPSDTGGSAATGSGLPAAMIPSRPIALAAGPEARAVGRGHRRRGAKSTQVERVCCFDCALEGLAALVCFDRPRSLRSATR